MKYRTRIAPSPTGKLHIGTARTALFSYLFAKQNGGEFILRIEDTDKERSTKEYEENIIDSLAWLELNYSEIYRQSERTAIYKKYLTDMVEKGLAYVSQEKEIKAGGRSEVIRFKNPNKVVKFKDLIRGEVSFDTTELGDFVLAKDFDTPLFHLAVVVDDYEMTISHVIRGEDHISNTPRQILIAEAIGAPVPTYAHLPLILAPNKSKMSKRDGAVAISDYRDAGYLKDAMINFMALLGWSPQSGGAGDEEDIFSLEDLENKFKLEAVNKSGAVFNIEKLDWLNSQYIKKMSHTDLEEKVTVYLPELSTLPDLRKKAFLNLITERISKFSDLEKLKAEGEWDYLFKRPEEVPLELVKSTLYLKELITLLDDISEEEFTAEKVRGAIWDFATEKGRGEVLGPMRVVLSGRKQSPDPFVIAQILGKKETLDRLELFLSKI